MSKSTDERGRIYLPKAVRERFGDQYRIVELPSYVALFPVDENPLDGLQAAVGDTFESEESNDLKAEARTAIAREIQNESERGSRTDEE